MSISFPLEGVCMCRECHVRVAAPPVMTMACHCKGCQKLSASAFSLTAMFPANAFAVIAGEPQVGALHGDTPYYFCPNCLNWLYTAPLGAPVINVRPSLFDVPAWSTPFVECYVSEKLPWAHTAAKHSFPQYPAPDQYGPLMAEFAALEGAAAGEA